MSRKSFNEAVDDASFLVAKGRFIGDRTRQKALRREHVDKLTNAVLKVLATHGKARIRAIGMYARLNAIDAAEQATSLCRVNTGLRLCIEIEKEKGNIGDLRSETHIQDVDAWVFVITFFKEKTDDNN